MLDISFKSKLFGKIQYMLHYTELDKLKASVETQIYFTECK